LAENEREKAISISDTNLSIVRSDNSKKTEIARIEASLAAKEREAELQKLVNIRIREQQIEFMRSETLAKATVEAESIERLADSEFYREKKKAEAVQLLLESQANGLQKIYQSCGGNASLTQFYLALNANLYPELARESANAVQGLNPKINVWNTSGDSNSNADTMKPIIKMVQSFSPLLEGLQTQGNIKLPDWLPRSTTGQESEQTTKDNQ